MANTKKTATKPAAKTAAKAVEKPVEKVAIPTTKDTTKAIETKGFEMKDVPAEKAPAKTTTAKKTTTKKAELKTSFTIQTLDGKEVSEKDLIKKVKEVWTKNYKKKVGDLKSIELFVKQEENSVYFAANNEVFDRVDLF